MEHLRETRNNIITHGIVVIINNILYDSYRYWKDHSN